ncbi:MAG: hypothetical protein PHT27_07415 [Candidatus Izemoplasmatales bacterium]|nr:hypothetical protein [Candidatus Izemoplasmatales bacterium]MDD4357572.1 hypothetical protein [Smithellaceae bacterium]
MSDQIGALPEGLSRNILYQTGDGLSRIQVRMEAETVWLSQLKQHHISDSHLASWAEDEFKRDFLARLFDALVRAKDNKGYAVILNMAQSLAEMKHFPDLENREDSSDAFDGLFTSVQRYSAWYHELAGSNSADMATCIPDR